MRTRHKRAPAHLLGALSYPAKGCAGMPPRFSARSLETGRGTLLLPWLSVLASSVPRPPVQNFPLPVENYPKSLAKFVSPRVVNSMAREPLTRRAHPRSKKR